MSRTLRAAAAVLIFTAIRTSAHHAFAAEYDENKLVTVSGIVAKGLSRNNLSSCRVHPLP
jgi:hypothetical protein